MLPAWARPAVWASRQRKPRALRRGLVPQLLWVSPRRKRMGVLQGLEQQLR